MPETVHVRVLVRAAEILGGKAELRVHLRVSMRELEAWLAGRDRPPAYVFLRAVDLIGSQGDRSLQLHEALKAAVKASGAQRGNIQAASPDGLRIVTQLGFEKRFLDFFSVVTHDTPSCCGPAAAKAQRVVVSEVGTHPIFAGTEAAEVMTSAGAAACQSTPLLDVSGSVIGMLSTHYERPHEPTAAELSAIDELARGVSRLIAP